MSMHQYMPDQAILADLLDIVLSRVRAENENHHGDTSPGWEGNTHLRMRVRSQGTDYRGRSLTGAPCCFYDRGP